MHFNLFVQLSHRLAYFSPSEVMLGHSKWTMWKISFAELNVPVILMYEIARGSNANDCHDCSRSFLRSTSISQSVPLSDDSM